jgi:uncharacterized protein YjbJ (UPF0337 family)
MGAAEPLTPELSPQRERGLQSDGASVVRVMRTPIAERVMNKDEIKGKVEQVQGKAKQVIGKVTDDPQLHDEGVADEASGDVREGVGKVKRNIGEAIEDVGERIKR